LPHESLEMVIRFLRKTPLMGAGNKPVYINNPAHLRDAEDMIADAEFSFNNEFQDAGKGISRKSSFSGGMPIFDSDDDEEVEAYTREAEEEDEEEYDLPAPVAAADKLDPFRALCIKDVTGVCHVGEALFVISKSGDKYRAVFKGEQVEVPIDAVEASDKRASVVSDFGGGDDDEEDEDGFGGFEEAEAELAKREAMLQEVTTKTAEELQREAAERIAKIEAGHVEIEFTEEEKAEQARVAEEQRKLQEQLAALENDDFGGFGDDPDDDDE